MNGELGPLHIRNVGLRGARTYRSPVSRGGSAVRPTVARRATKPGRVVLTEEEERKDFLDTVIAKAEEIRPVCPVDAIEDAWVKFTNWVVDTTPEIPILPAPKE